MAPAVPRDQWSGNYSGGATGWRRKWYWLEKEMVQDWGVGNTANKAWLVWGQMGKIRLSVNEMVTSQMQRGRG